MVGRGSAAGLEGGKEMVVLLELKGQGCLGGIETTLIASTKENSTAQDV